MSNTKSKKYYKEYKYRRTLRFFFNIMNLYKKITNEQKMKEFLYPDYYLSFPRSPYDLIHFLNISQCF